MKHKSARFPLISLRSAALLCLVLIGALTGCGAVVGKNAMTTLPKDGALTCESHCEEMGLSLDSVVIMASNVGCVCTATRNKRGSGAAAGAGLSTILSTEEAAATLAATRRR